MKRKPLSWELAVGKEEENGKVWGQPCGQGAAVQRWEVAVSPGGQPAGQRRRGWAGQVLQAFAPPTGRLLPLPRPPRCGPSLCTLSTSDTKPPLWRPPRHRSCLSISGSVFSSLSTRVPDHPLCLRLPGGVDFLGLLQPRSPPSSLLQSLAGQWPALLRCVPGADLAAHPSF